MWHIVIYVCKYSNVAKAVESVNSKILNKLNSKLSFLGRYKEFLIPKMQRIL